VVTAIGTAWMASTLLAGVGALVGPASMRSGTMITLIGTGVLSILLFRRFWRLGRVDEVPVASVVTCWALLLGLLSL
jgi:hypothetical protein